MMNRDNSKEYISKSPTNAAVNTTISLATKQSRRRITEIYFIIWIINNTDLANEEYQNTLEQLQDVANDVYTFTNCDECIDFLTEVNDRKAFLIVPNSMAQQLIPSIHHISQLDSIYIYCSSEISPEDWRSNWDKVKGAYMERMCICKALNATKNQYNRDDISVSFVDVNQHGFGQSLNQLEPSFMYTQLLKEILLNMKYEKQAIQDFVQFWRNEYTNNPTKLKDIAQFERDYCPQSSIWWYSRECFLYEMLNWSLRTLEAEGIMKMGFLIYDLHWQIESLYKQQISLYHEKTFQVFRGQGLSTTDFEKLKKTKGGLISFNNFLSTSKNRDICLCFAEAAAAKADTVGILFQMSIDPTISTTSFASIRELSSFGEEDEILFSMHTVFRIDGIRKLHSSHPTYQVDLKLTVDNDQQLNQLTKRIEEEISDSKGWQRLGDLLLKIGQLPAAEKFYIELLKRTTGDRKRAYIYHQLGWVKQHQGKYKEAAFFYEKSLEIGRIIFLDDDSSLAPTYSNIGLMYHNMSNYYKALEFYEKDLKITEKIVPLNHLDLASSYNNIGGVYENMGNYSTALEFYTKVVKIRERALPPNHPDLATTYNNIGLVHYYLGDYSKALEYFERTLEIREKTQPSYHSELATSNNNIGALYDKIGNCPKALEFHEKALKIREKALPPSHPELGASYNNIGGVYCNMGNYSKALEFYEKALKVFEEALSPSHPSLATSYNNIGAVYNRMDAYQKALEFHEKALTIREKTLPQNHPDLSQTYNNIGAVYDNMRDYSKAVEFYQRTLDIDKKTLPLNHPNVAISYDNIGQAYEKKGEYLNASQFYERAVEIAEQSLSLNHPQTEVYKQHLRNVKKNI